MIRSFNPPNLAKVQSRALIVGVVGIVLLLIGAFLNRDQFFQSYLVGFTFWAGIAVGSLALLMLQHLTGGGWGLVIRRVLEASTRTLPLIFALFIPIIIGAHSLYPWTHADVLEESAVVKFKAGYLNLPFFTIRAVIIFVVWFVLYYLLNRWSLQQDKTGDRSYVKYMRLLSAPGMVLLIFSVTFAAVDWYMSLEPEWFSTIFGLLFVAAWSLSALAFTIAVMAALAKNEPMNQIVAPLHFHDLGKLLLALVMLWAYFAFSQFLIIWSGNLPEEIHYYLPRIKGVLGVTIVVVAILHFAAPFLFLLSRSTKRNPQKLVIIALLVLVMRVIDLYWVLKPAFAHSESGSHASFITWTDIVSPIAIGGIWIWFFAWQLGKRALIPINDPQFESTMEQQHASGH
jgi:hypothetical protein